MLQVDSTRGWSDKNLEEWNSAQQSADNNYIVMMLC